MASADSIRISITTIRTLNFTARLIHVGMWLWCVLRLVKPIKINNHCEVRYNFSGEVLTSGAIAEGVVTRKWSDYLNTHDIVRYTNYGFRLTKEEWKRGKAYLDSAEGTKYEVSNFFWHAVKIFTGWWGGSNSARELYCYEHAIRFLNAAKGFNYDTNLNPYQATKLFEKTKEK